MPKGIPKGVPKKYKGQMGGYRENSRRHKIPIDWEYVDKYLMAGCTGTQIAALLDIHPMTLYNRTEEEKGMSYTDYSYSKREKGNGKILGKQYQLALEGDRTMLVWLGKNRCLQTDKVEQNIKAEHTMSQKVILELPDNGRRQTNDTSKEDTTAAGTAN